MKGLGIHIEEVGKSLNIISASVVRVADVFTKTQVTGSRKKLLQCCVLRGNRQSPEILVSLERMKALHIIHETFGSETIDEYLFNNGNKLNKYSEIFICVIT